ncbi:MAG: manganese efflux pump MntP family protein [Oscillospiraceae bacterium]|jgi:putative Mn2+ efflux pump MntP|nr:manganese efflux pump MntP family protein [Oscillospiraceae bacterium]
MGIAYLLLIAVVLSIDAFAVSVSSGMVLCFTTIRQNLRIAGSFGLFQGLMPFLGYTIARTFSSRIESLDHWVAFGLLSFIGIKMLWETRGTEEMPSGDPSRWDSVLLMATATSIDALAVGASLAILPQSGLLALPYGFVICCVIIALITFLLCLCGVIIGCRFGNLFGKKAQVLGGIILIGIGLKILIEHTVLA